MSILFCTPCYGGMVHAAHMQSCLNLKEALTQLALPHDWLFLTNESAIQRARNTLTATFLETEHTHMMWLDSDIEFTPDDVAKVWNLDADIGVGVYAMKKEGEDWYAAWVSGKLVKDLDQFNETAIAVDYAGTGFMLMKRDVLETLSNDVEHYECVGGRQTANLWQFPVVDNALLPEDYNFCRMAREAGYSIIMDPTVRLKHWGQKAYGSD